MISSRDKHTLKINRGGFFWQESNPWHRGFARQPCCMAGTMKMFCIRKNICSHSKKNLLFLPCNMAAVQNLYCDHLVACLVTGSSPARSTVFPLIIWPTLLLMNWFREGSRVGAVMKALSSHQCNPGSNPWPGVTGVTCWFSPDTHVSSLLKNQTIIGFEGIVSKETVVLRRWGSSKQKFGFINGVDNVNWPPYRDSKSWRFER